MLEDKEIDERLEQVKRRMIEVGAMLNENPIMLIPSIEKATGDVVLLISILVSSNADKGMSIAVMPIGVIINGQDVKNNYELSTEVGSSLAMTRVQDNETHSEMLERVRRGIDG